jgi:hypothetical protein
LEYEERNYPELSTDEYAELQNSLQADMQTLRDLRGLEKNAMKNHLAVSEKKADSAIRYKDAVYKLAQEKQSAPAAEWLKYLSGEHIFVEDVEERFQELQKKVASQKDLPYHDTLLLYMEDLLAAIDKTERALVQILKHYK